VNKSLIKVFFFFCVCVCVCVLYLVFVVVLKGLFLLQFIKVLLIGLILIMDTAYGIGACLGIAGL
jgi:hypothetical protein